MGKGNLSKNVGLFSLLTQIYNYVTFFKKKYEKKLNLFLSLVPTRE